MGIRIQVILEEREKEQFRRQAQKAGLSLSAWLRQAGLDKLRLDEARRIRTTADLQHFFADCDQREAGREPDWEEHLQVMARSRGGP